MDGTLGRANCLVITMLWSVFKLLMVPIGFQLAGVFPPATYGVLFAIVWLSYIGSDGASEIVGSLFGKQKLKVWGIGEVNKKSVAGTWACFLASLAICVGLVFANGLPPVWIGLAVAVSISNTFFELFSPRGTDDFTMATANALICWAFGVLVY
jgi:dolichol kinase